jgi:hypothetical protein
MYHAFRPRIGVLLLVDSQPSRHLANRDAPDAAQRSVSVVTPQRPVSLESQPLSITSLDIAPADSTQGDPDISTSSLIMIGGAT